MFTRLLTCAVTKAKHLPLPRQGHIKSVKSALARVTNRTTLPTLSQVHFPIHRGYAKKSNSRSRARVEVPPAANLTVQEAKTKGPLKKRSQPTPDLISELQANLKWLDTVDFGWKALTAEEKEDILQKCPFYEHLSPNIKLPMNPCSGVIDFRFIEKPYFDDPVISKMIHVCPPESGHMVFLQAVSGAGKTGSIFAYARKYFTLYAKVTDDESIDASDFKDSTYRKFNTLMMSLEGVMEYQYIRDKSTLYVTIACQMMWLSHAIVLARVRDKYKEAFKPEHWLAYIMNGGRKHIDMVFHQFSIMYMKLLDDPMARVGVIQGRLGIWLEELTPNVAFAIDEAQIAQAQFPNIPIISSKGKPRTLLSALAMYSLSNQTRIVTGTRMTNFEQILESGESKFRVVSLKSQELQLPIASPEDAVDFVTQFYRDRLEGYLGLQSEIGLFAQGRLRRSANLNTFIFYAKPSKLSPQLEDYVETGLQDMKDEIKKYINRRLDSLEKKFKTDAELHKKWRDLLKMLFVNSSVGDLEMSDKKCLELGINIEDLGFALVSVDQAEERYVSIKEPYSFEVFRNWLKKVEQPYVDDYEQALQKAVGPMYHPNPAQKGYDFERVIAALMLNLRDTSKLRDIQFLKGVTFDHQAPDWLNQPFTNKWSRLGTSMDHSMFSELFKLLKKLNFKNPDEVYTAVKGTILEKLFSADNKRNQQVIDALVKIRKCERAYWGELLLLLTQYENELLMPSKYYGPDVMGFSGGVLIKVGIYMYSPKDNNSENLKAKEEKNERKFTKNYYSDKKKKYYPMECGVALEAIKAVASWKEIHLDIGIPRSKYSDLKPTSTDNNSIWIPLWQDHIMEVVHDRNAFQKVLKILGIAASSKTDQK